MKREEISINNLSRERSELSIATAIREEKQHACQKHPALASQHEAYAVLLEEIEEAADKLKRLTKAAAEYWEAVKTDDHPTIGLKLAVVGAVAQGVANEAVQVAAVVLKAQDLYGMEHTIQQLEIGAAAGKSIEARN
jgi:exopolyphosphatase/pppGpp-phosphohydrolase